MTKKLILFVFLITLFLLNRPLWAQSAQNGGGRYVIEQRYVQQLVWRGDEYTLKYEVVIEQYDGGYKAYIQEFTEKPSLLVSLPLGKYRYRIIPYDYLEQPGEASDWINIEIKPPPAVPADVQKTDDRNQTPSADEKEKTAPDVKEAVINNIDDSAATEENETEKPLNLYISAAWSPLIPLYGRMQEIFGSEFYAGGASVRFGALYGKLQWFSLGAEISTSWYSLNNSMDGDEISVQTGVTGFNIVAQKKLPNPRMAAAVRTGLALAYQVGEINIDDYSYTTGGMTPQINIEASFLWFAYKRLYLEAGIGFTHLLGKDNNSGCLRPWIGAGWEF